MRFLLLIPFLLLSAIAQVTSTTPANFTGSNPVLIGGKFAQRETGPSPFAKQLVINGTGAWNIGTITGTATSAIRCGFAGSAAVSNCTLSGTAPSTIFVFFDGYTNNVWDAGTRSAVVPIVNTGATVNVSVDITVVARTTLTITSVSGSFNGCANTSNIYLDLDTCPITDQRPSGTFTPPAIGSTYVDAQFGGTVKKLAGAPNAGRVHPYSSVSACNSDYTRCFVVGPTGIAYIINPTDGTVVHSSVPSAGAFWDASDSTKYYYTSGKTLHRVVLPTLTDTVHYTYPGVSVTISAGGTGDSSKDNWWAFFTDETEKQVCGLNLNNVAQAPCSTYSLTPSLGTVDFVQITKGVSVSTAKRYIIAAGTSYAAMYQFVAGDANLTFFGRMPTKQNEQWYATTPQYATACTDAIATAGWCHNAEHMDTVEIAGEQYYGLAFQQSNPFVGHMLLMKIASGDLMTTASEAGGGGYYNLPQTSGNYGQHIGCAKQSGNCVIEKYLSPTITSFRVTGATNAAPIMITSDPAFTGANGNVVLINDVAGNTTANGLCTVAALSGTTFNCSGTTGNGTYIAGTGSYTLNTTPAVSPHGFELYVTNGLTSVRRVAIHRSVPYSYTYQGVGGYYDQPRTSINYNGSYLIFDSNFGYPDGLGVYSATTNFPDSAQGGSIVGGKTVIGGKVVIQ